jgi:predicted MFS family arabinose efflux permease
VIWALAVIRPRQEHHEPDGESAVRMLTAGLRHARHHRRIYMHLLTAATITIFGMPFLALLPVIAAETLGMGSTGYSTLMGLNGAGALIGALTVASLPGHVRRDTIVRWSVTGMAVGVIALSQVRTGWVAGIVMVLMGAAFLAAVSSINTNLQVAAPPKIRGRIMSLFVLAFMGMMPIGSLIFGALGEVIGVTTAVLLGGLVLLALGLALIARPGLLCDRGDAECAPARPGR